MLIIYRNDLYSQFRNLVQKKFHLFTKSHLPRGDEKFKKQRLLIIIKTLSFTNPELVYTYDDFFITIIISEALQQVFSRNTEKTKRADKIAGIRDYNTENFNPSLTQ